MLPLTLNAASPAPLPPKSLVPNTWTEHGIAELEVPLAQPAFSPMHVSVEYYYRLPARPIFKSYPIYHPKQEPPGYFEDLLRKEPELLWDDKGTAPRLETDADWIRAGELVFDSPTDYGSNGKNGTFTLAEVRDPAWYDNAGVRLAVGGLLPDLRYVIREKGKVEVGSVSCANCHTRVMGNGTVVKGAQGNFPFEQARAWAFQSGRRPEKALRFGDRGNFAVPWITDDPEKRLAAMTFSQILALGEATPPGVMARARTSPFHPVQIPDLIGVTNRHHLDHTGLVRHRSVADLMRYSAMNQDADGLSSFGGFIPDAEDFQTRPPPEEGGRYTDQQLYALALYIYSLEAPANPNLPSTAAQKDLAIRGEELFHEERCASCHKPPLYTNDKLIPVSDFQVPHDHWQKFDVMETKRIDTDPSLTLKTRRGTGYYKVPSLLGVWYRGPFEHNGSCDVGGLVRPTARAPGLRAHRLERPARDQNPRGARARLRPGTDERGAHGAYRISQNAVNALPPPRVRADSAWHPARPGSRLDFFASLARLTQEMTERATT